MQHGDGLWWLALITQLVVLVAAAGAVIYLCWLNYKIKRSDPRRDVNR